MGAFPVNEQAAEVMMLSTIRLDNNLVDKVLVFIFLF